MPRVPASICALALAGACNTSTALVRQPVASVTVTPSPDTVVVGRSSQLSATVRGMSGGTLSDRPVSWETLDATVVTVSQAGLATSHDTGYAKIAASSEGKSDTAIVVVVPGPVASVVVTPLVDTLTIGDSRQLIATPRDSAGYALSGRTVSWFSSDTSIAKVSSTGLVMATGGGLVTITASTEGRAGQSSTYVLVHFAIIRAAYSHTCALTSDGIAFCWGSNANGQLGSGDVVSSSTPARVKVGLTFTDIAAGGNGVDNHACAIASTGGLYCWGRNQDGGLGDGTQTDRHVPTLVLGGRGYIAVGVGAFFTCAVASDSSAYCWGYNFNGQLGNGSNSQSITPVAVSGGHLFTSMAVGNSFACGLTPGGSAYCWGRNLEGELGDSGSADSKVPVPVAGGHVFAQITTGDFTACGVETGGAAFCWGNGLSGQLGDDARHQTNYPVAVHGGLTFATVSAGGIPACGVTIGGEAYCWGGSATGAQATPSSMVPVLVDGGQTYVAVSAGRNHACGIVTGSFAYCWGEGSSGQLGIGPTSGSAVPVRVSLQP